MFPATLPIKTLTTRNPLFDAERMRRYDALYRGGSAAVALSRDMLFKRRLERVKADLFEERVKRTGYTPHGAVIDFLVAAVFLDEPRFVGHEYFEGLNDDADGNGLDLAALARQVLTETLLYGDAPGAYLVLDFDQETGVYSKPETLAARWRFLPAEVVDDWGPGWIRVHTLRQVRENPWSDANTVEQWAYLTDAEVATFSRVVGAKSGPATESVSGVVAAHDFKRCPAFSVRMSHAGMWVMDRIAPILEGLYNRESALTYALDQGCFPVPVLNREQETKSLICSETHAIKLRHGETFSFVAPPATVYDPAFKDLERLQTNLARAVHGLALEAAAKTQAPRQGAFAAAMQRGPLDALLWSFASPVRDLLETVARAVAQYQHIPEPKLEGFERFDASLDGLADAVGQGRPVAGTGAPADNAPPKSEVE